MAVAQALQKSYTYLEYRNIVSSLLSQGKSTGQEQSEELTNYSSLNNTRMKRLDKTIVVAEDVIKDILALEKSYIWLVLSEGWCGDAAQLLPIMNKMQMLSSQIDLQIVFRDENPKLMDLFLTNGSRSVPKLILIDTENMSIVGHWGPRPKGATDLIVSYKAQYGVVDETAKTELQLWYLHDKGFSTQREIVQMMLDSEALKGK